MSRMESSTEKKPKYFEEVPDTLQGLTLYKMYAESKIKSNLRQNKKLEKLLGECIERIAKKEKDVNNG